MHMRSPVKASAGNYAKHGRGGNRRQRRGRCKSRIQEEPCASPGALFRVRPRTAEDRGRIKRAGMASTLQTNAYPRGVI